MIETMYPASVNSRQTELATDIDDTQTSFTVLDGSALPPAPNQLTLGTDESAETIKYTGKTGNEITGVTRGFEGVARSWMAGTKLARYFTAYDHNTFKANIEDLDRRLENIPAPQDASLTDKGIVQLSNKTDGTSESVAATEKAVKEAYDRGSAGVSAAQAAQTIINNRDGYGLTTNSGNTYAVTLTPAPAAYVDGLRITIKINAANTGAVTINVNGLGAKSVLKSNGSAMASNALRANSVYSLVYNGANFILQGEGGSGNALPSDVVLGKTFTNDDGEAVGTLVSYGAGDVMSYTKLGLTAMPPKTHIFNSPLGLSTATMGMCIAKDGSGYYTTFLDGTLIRLAKFDNYGKLLWNIQVGNTPVQSTYVVPIEGTRDGGVCVYMRETGRNDNSLIKYNSAGQLFRKYYVPVNEWPVDVKIDTDGTIFTSVANDISRLDVDDSFSSTATNALRTWNISRSQTNSAIVVYNDYVYFVYGLGSSTFLGRITKGPSSPVLSTYAINPWSDENIIGTSLIGDGSGRLYVGSTAGRLYALNWNLGKSWDMSTNSTAIYDITFNNNKIYVLGRLSGVTDTAFNMVSAVKTISYTGAYENEFPVLIQSSFVNSGMDTRKGQGQLLKFTSDPPNNLIVGLQRSTTLYLNNLQIQP
jgi:hypothetical protein